MKQLDLFYAKIPTNSKLTDVLICIESDKVQFKIEGEKKFDFLRTYVVCVTAE